MQLPAPRLCSPRHNVTATSSPGLGTQGTWDVFSTPYLPQLAVSNGSNLGPFPVYFAQLKSRSCQKRELAAPGDTRCCQDSAKVEMWVGKALFRVCYQPWGHLCHRLCCVARSLSPGEREQPCPVLSAGFNCSDAHGLSEPRSSSTRAAARRLPSRAAGSGWHSFFLYFTHFSGPVPSRGLPRSGELPTTGGGGEPGR